MLSMCDLSVKKGKREVESGKEGVLGRAIPMPGPVVAGREGIFRAVLYVSLQSSKTSPVQPRARDPRRTVRQSSGAAGMNTS